MITNEFVKDIGKTLFSEMDFSCLDFLDSLNKDVKHNLVNFLFTTFYAYELVYTKDVLQMMVENKIWENADALNHLYETTQYDYNPIWNKDGVIRETITIEGSDGRTITDKGNKDITNNSTKNRTLDVDISRQDGGSVTSKNGGTTTVSNTGTDSDSTSTESTVSDYPMNSTAKKNRENTVATGSNTKTLNTKSTESIDTTDTETRNLTGSENRDDVEKITDSGTINETSGNTQTNEGTSKSSEVREVTETGNIGVTMTQQMIEAERNIILVIYNHIVALIKDFFYLNMEV